MARRAASLCGSSSVVMRSPSRGPGRGTRREPASAHEPTSSDGAGNPQPPGHAAARARSREPRARARSREAESPRAEPGAESPQHGAGNREPAHGAGNHMPAAGAGNFIPATGRGT